MKLIAPFLLLPFFGAFAQPATDIYLFKIDLEEGILSESVNITNRQQGYDNQPHFSPDGKRLYFTREVGGQTDIYFYDLEDKKVRNFAETAESEYSPTVMPSGDAISVIQVEKDSTQRLWSLPMDGDAPKLLLEDVKPVGYHAWADENMVGMFVLGAPNTFQVADMSTGQSKIVTTSIGRSIHSKDGLIYFLHKENGDQPNTWWIKTYNPQNEELKQVIRPLNDTEDYCSTRSGQLLMGDGENLYIEKNGEWNLFSKVEIGGISGFNRIAISPDETLIAVVVSY
ncbi:MAG: hypothetical protein RJQ09_08615 [Cyclobacteriaceae bacterium]